MQRNQFKKSGRYSSLLWPALIVLLSSCATGQMGTQQVGQLNAEPTELLLGVDAATALEPAQAVIDVKAKLRGKLEPHAVNSGLKLKKLVADVRNKNKNTAGGTKPFKGLGGGYYHSLLRVAQGKVNQNNEEYDTSKTSTLELSGLITGYTFDRMGTDKGKGTLIVDTYQTVKHEGVTVEVTNYVWDIEIKPNGYVIHEHSGDDDDPFPGTLAFNQAMKDRIKDKGYNVKLHARGGKIHVNSLIKDGFEIESNDKNFGPLLKVDPENCIDMFLKVGLGADGKPDLDQIPLDHNDLTTNFFYSYCLGRCKDPAIVNSR